MFRGCSRPLRTRSHRTLGPNAEIGKVGFHGTNFTSFHTYVLLHDTDDSELCSGVMYIRSNQKTRQFFNPEHIDVDLITCDQIYVNKMKHQLNYEKLPLFKYPNGKYFRERQPNNPHLIHYNYLIGKDKKMMMQQDGNWLI